jgi:NTE family protein
VSLALVLAGGGARGAYEAGVLRFVLGTLPKLAGEPVRPEIVCGTSVGALNGIHAAAHAGRPGGPAELSAFWRNLTLSKVYRFEALDLLRSPMRLFGGGTVEPPSLVDNAPLHALIKAEFPAKALRAAFRDQALRAVVITATEVATGRCVHFLDARQGTISELLSQVQSRSAGVITIPTRLTADHCLASCAIPFLFPPVVIDGRAMMDGSLRQNTPLSPALRLGATKVLVVGVKKELEQTDVHEEPDALTLALIGGKTLDALLLDPIERDLARMRLLNEVFQWGEEAYGEDFLTNMNAVVERHRGAPFRQVKAHLVRPSRDLGRVASEAWASGKVDGSRASRMLLEAIAVREQSDEADLLSYLLFDRSFTAVLEDLGYSDARDQQEEIAAFLGLGTS